MKKQKGKRMGLFNAKESERTKRRKENKTTTKMLLICETKGNHCNQDGYRYKVGNVVNLYCCKQGFFDSLADFKRSI